MADRDPRRVSESKMTDGLTKGEVKMADGHPKWRMVI